MFSVSQSSSGCQSEEYRLVVIQYKTENGKNLQIDLRIDNGDLRAMCPQWCVFSDNLVIYYLIWT